MNLTSHRHLILAGLLAALALGALSFRPAPAASDSTAGSVPADPPGAGTGLVDPATAPHGIGVTAAGAEYVRGELAVSYRGEVAPRTVAIPPSQDPVRAADRIEDRPGVKDASPNYIARISSWLPNDPGLNPDRRGRAGRWASRQWNFLPCFPRCQPGPLAKRPHSRGGMNVLTAWRRLRKTKRPGAAGVRVAVLDTGIAYRNYGRRFRRDPDLAAKRFLPGRDFVAGNHRPLDRNGHGTHVASTIAQTTDNGRGLTGIAYRARLIPVRVMDANGMGSLTNIVAGVRWAADHGARVMVMSINFRCGVQLPALDQALAYAHRKGVVIVGSSGNRDAQSCPSMPATSPKVLSVGGTTESGCVGWYSFRSDRVDIAAPGGGSSQAGCPYRTRNRPILQVGMLAGKPNRFGIETGWVGTSMAAAHAAGAAAAVLASGVLPGGRNADLVRERLIRTARLPAWAKNDPASGFGAGIIDLGRAVNPRAKLNPPAP